MGGETILGRIRNVIVCVNIYKREFKININFARKTKEKKSRWFLNMMK